MHGPVNGDVCGLAATAPPAPAVVDTRLLARHVLPGVSSYGLDALLAHEDIPQPPRRHRAMDDVTVTAALFHRLLTRAARPRAISSLGDLVRVAARTPRAAQPIQLEFS
ncbi:exonuclease domain-containing protein [Streptomyces violascens]|uniref:exonuclease domain-containing protein n=1 Tax=Streptomyces violascens TaxID=67381 RepID=UPI0037930F22